MVLDTILRCGTVAVTSGIFSSFGKWIDSGPNARSPPSVQWHGSAQAAEVNGECPGEPRLRVCLVTRQLGTAW